MFVSYSREDAKWRRKFVVMLAPDVRERRLEVWSDDCNVVGKQWRPQLRDAIRRSRAALLLISPDYLASEFIMEQELPRADQARRHAGVRARRALPLAERAAAGGGPVGA